MYYVGMLLPASDLATDMPYRPRLPWHVSYRADAEQNAVPDAGHFLPERVRRAVIWGFIIAIAWVPAAVALAMIVTGNAGS